MIEIQVRGDQAFTIPTVSDIRKQSPKNYNYSKSKDKSMRINKLITLRTMLDLQTNSFNKFFKIMYEYQLRKFVIKSLTPAP